jgi:peptide/nickel transport system ATP-binding protein
LTVAKGELQGRLLEVKDLRVHFETEDGLVKAVDGVSFALDRGQTLGIVGESGSGKSVANLTILGLTRAPNTRISGRVMLEGRDLLQLDDAQIRSVSGAEIAMVFQDPLASLHPYYTVGTQLVEAIQVHHEVPTASARVRAIELLDLVGIPSARDRVRHYPHELSGGMRQRAMIAMALANDPKVLIADEPTTALDVTTQAQILGLIGRLQSELGMAVILITHDLGVVAENAHEIAVMYAGRIVEHASAEAIFTAPEHPYTWGLLRSIPRITAAAKEAELIPIPGAPPSLIQLPSGCSFHPRCPYARPRHRKIDPALEQTPARQGHEVACLLPVDTRRALWEQLRAGRDPVEAATAVGLGDAAVRTEPVGLSTAEGAG